MSSLQTFIAYKFVRDMATPFKEWDAFKLGIIDKNGKTLKSPKNSEEKDAFGKMNIMARNIKRLLSKLPFGSSKLGSFAAAMILLKEDEIDRDVFISEIYGDVPYLEESAASLLPGKYTTDPELFDDLVEMSGMFDVREEIFPCDNIHGENIFTVKDIVTRKTMALPESLLVRI